MSPESFTDLALRVVSREATDDERHALESELTASASRREEFEQLKLTHEILRATAPMVDAARTTTPELPVYRVNELRTAVRQHFGPAANRGKAPTKTAGLLNALRWIFAGGGLAGLGFVIVVFCFANRSIEVGLYKTDLARSGDQALSAQDVPSAQLLTFDQDAPFDQWQNRSLAWDEHAKIWVDNEHDLLHIVRRVRTGQIITETQPLAPNDEAQRAQIKQVVESLRSSP
jgi:hypothetical protein